MSSRFQPPKWCSVPKDWEKHARQLTWVGSAEEGAKEQHSIGSKAVYTIGRDDSADVRLSGELASRIHAAILLDGEGRKFLVDLKSTHGTFLGSTRLTPNKPVRWPTGEQASFGSGSKAEVAELQGGPPVESGTPTAAAATALVMAESWKRKAAEDDEEDSPRAVVRRTSSDDVMASLYGDLPEATVESVVPRTESIRAEPLPPVPDPTKIIFLDIDGCLRPLHGRKDFAKNVRSMVVEGVKVPLLGDGEAKAGLIGLDFWPQALRALRHIVQKTEARIVLSSDWRKQAELMEGINGQLQEHRMPQLFGATPDLDAGGVGVVKAIHDSPGQKRCKEIRKWLRQHPKIQRWVAIDDIDLSITGKGADPSVCLDSDSDFVRCAPMVGLTLDLAKLAVNFLNDVPVSPEMKEAAYAASSAGAAQAGSAPEPFQMSMGGPEPTPGLMPGLA